MDPTPGEITQLLIQLTQGNQEAEARLMPLVYSELRRLGRHYMRNERPDHTLQATALVHEAYLRLAGQKEISWQSRAHFFGVAASVMRRILVDHARAHKAEKRGGHEPKVSLDEALAFTENNSERVLAMDEALTRLAERDPRLGRIVELRFFAGLTVKRDWRVAKAWLRGELSFIQSDDSGPVGTSERRNS
jgi:RNA polymerase sigma factor (TIGR02999 family)